MANLSMADVASAAAVGGGGAVAGPGGNQGYDTPAALAAAGTITST